jgi:hypothetical protein
MGKGGTWSAHQSLPPTGTPHLERDGPFLGGGIGRVFKFAGQAFNAQVEAFYNVLRAGPGSISTPGDWQFRFEIALLFPE